MSEKPEKTRGKVVRAETQPFNGREEPSATAQCPSGMTCTGGGVDVPPGAVVTASRKTEDGSGWYGAFAGGPSGHIGVVRALCEPAKPGPGESGELRWRVRWRR